MTDKPEWTWRHATELRDHWWWRPGWRLGTRYYAFHLAVGDTLGVAELVTQYQDAIRRIDALDLIPREWLHITMQGLAFVEDIAEEDLASVVKATREAVSELDAFTLTFDRPVIRPEALVLAPDPVEPIDHLRDTVRTAIEKALGPGTIDLGPTDFQPHVSFAYVNADQQAADVLAQLDAVRGAPAEFYVDSVPLIEMHRDNRMYEWRTLGTLPLRASAHREPDRDPADD